jgi:acetylornithine deacetylase/succinyl-diaminopimelate desuccinylase-like protein
LSARAEAQLIDRERLAETLMALVGAPSVNPFGGPPSDSFEGETEAAVYVAHRLDALGWASEMVAFEPGRPSLLASPPGEAGPPAGVVLAGHLDTVAVDGYAEPFAGRRVGSRITGRGACDMKAAIACYIEVAEVLAASGRDDVGRRLVIAAVADEEHLQRGAKSVRPLLAGSDLVVIGEPTELRICTAARGLAAFTVVVDGVATHSSVPTAGVNAIERAAELVDGLRAHAAALEGTVHPLLGHAVLNVGVIRGGIRANVVPPRCEIDVSRRLLPGETAQSARAELQRALRERCGDDHWSLSESWWTVDPYENRDPVVGRIQQAALRSGSAEVTPTGFPASSDAPYFGAPVVLCGPGSLAQAHSLDEWVDLEEMVAATRIYLELVLASLV